MNHIKIVRDIDKDREGDTRMYKRINKYGEV